MQDEKSQLQNKPKGPLSGPAVPVSPDRAGPPVVRGVRGPAGSDRWRGPGSEKIRTYNFKENRVTDHRIGLTLHKLARDPGR
ncbi:MAG: hypothetical protein Ct9H300mP12_07950 [Acidimicrobiales bacterium]|nr:MAG: hypothetical protein Ct9H300mP12_07950 [Acidimicrobiales bacterium]